MKNIIKIEKGMKFKNNKNGEVLLIIDTTENTITYNFLEKQSKIPYHCTFEGFHDWINKVNGEVIV